MARSKLELPLPMQITPNDHFYTLRFDRQPTVDRSNWTLVVEGLVEHPLRLTFEDILAMPQIETMRTLECISNPVGGALIGNAQWTGISLRLLLQQAGIKSAGKFLTFNSADDYYTTIPIESALDEQARLVHMMNGVPLPPFHGYPLRALIPGVYGQKQPKWIYDIEVVDHYQKGIWEKKGWSDTCFIQPNSRIDRPADGEVILGMPGDIFTISGIAFTGSTGAARVEVSADGGANWQPATLSRAPAPATDLVWTVWGFNWRVPANGKFTILARVSDNAGNSQSDSTIRMLDGTFPNGTSGIHTIVVEVRTP